MAHPHASPFHSFLAKMEVAVEMDVALNRASKPAIEKLQMLPKLWAMVHNCKSTLQLEFIRCGVLASLRKWLEPLPDGFLPNEQVRSMVLQILVALPIDLKNDAVMQKLKASGLGKSVMFLANLPVETNANKKLARELVDKWSRGIFEISDNFEDLKVCGEERPKPTKTKPPKKEEGVHNRLNGKLKELKKKNKFLSIQDRHCQMKREKSGRRDMKREKIGKGTC
jgi:transcription factor SPN1